MCQEYEIEERQLADLHPHPLQDIYFIGLDENQLTELAEDIERNELREPIEILPENSAGLPANTIISGHQRLRALLHLEYGVTDVQVRYDLADESAEVIERYLLDSNQNRQHLSKLQQARISLRLFEIEKNRPRGKVPVWQTEEARDRVGEQIGMSGRNLQRYWRVLQAPIEVQNAFDRNELPLILASRVADFSPENLRRITSGLGEDEKLRQVIEEILAKKETPKSVGQATRQFEKTLEHALDEIEPRFKEIKFGPSSGGLELLQRAVVFLKKLETRYAKNQKRKQEATEQLLQELQ